MTGMLLFAYLVFHLANFTFHVGVEGPFTDAQGRMDVYRMVVGTFAQPIFFNYIHRINGSCRLSYEPRPQQYVPNTGFRSL